MPPPFIGRPRLYATYLHASRSLSRALAARSPPLSHSRCFILATHRRFSGEAGRNMADAGEPMPLALKVGDSQHDTTSAALAGLSMRGGGESAAVLQEDMGVPGAEEAARLRLSRWGTSNPSGNGPAAAAATPWHEPGRERAGHAVSSLSS